MWLHKLKMSEKAENVQRKTLKYLQKTWRTIAQDHFKTLQKAWLLGRKIIRIRTFTQCFEYKINCHEPINRIRVTHRIKYDLQIHKLILILLDDISV